MSLTERVLALFLGNGLTQILNFLFILVAVRIFSILDYATFKQGTLLVATISPLLVLGIPISIGYFLPRAAKDMQEKARYIAQAVLALTCLGFLGALGLTLLAGKISRLFNNPDLRTYMIAFSLLLFCDVACSFYPFLLIAEKRNRRLAIVSVLFAAFRVLSLFLTVGLHKGLDFFLLLNVLVNIIRLAFMICDSALYFRAEAPILGRPLNKLKEQLSYSFPLGISQLLATLNSYIDKNLTTIFYMPNKYAIYVNGAFELPIVPIVSGSINSVIFPEFSGMYNKGSQEAKDNIIRLWNQSIEASAVLLLPAMFAFFVFADAIIELLFTKQYLDSVAIFRMYLIIIPTKLTYFGTPFVAAGKPRRLVLYAVFSLMIGITVYLIVHFMFGFNYLAISMVAANYVTSFIMLAEIGKIYGKRYSQIFPWGKIGVLIIFGLLISLPYKWILIKIYHDGLVFQLGGCAVLGVLLMSVMAMLLPGTRTIMRTMKRRAMGQTP